MLKRVRRKPGDPPPPHYVVNRRMPEDCWLIDKPVHLSVQATNWLTETVGTRGAGQCFQHLCEIATEPNRCIRPEHVVLGTKPSNTQHMHDLRRAAGLPWAGGRKAGQVMGKYKSEPWKCDCGWTGTRHGASLHRKRKHGLEGTVPPSAP